MSLLFLLSTPVKPPVPSLQRHVSVKPQTLGELFDTPDVCAAMQRNVGRLEHWTHRNHMKFNEMYGQKPHSKTVHKSGVFSRCLLPLTKVSFFCSLQVSPDILPIPVGSRTISWQALAVHLNCLQLQVSPQLHQHTELTLQAKQLLLLPLTKCF